MKQLLVFLSLLLISCATFAQISWGMKSGFNVSTLGTNNEVNEAKLGFHGGLYYLQRLEPQFGLGFELQYSLQGARDAVINSRSQSYNYIHLPVLIRFYLNDNSFVEVGPQLSYLLKANSFDEDFKMDITEDVKRWDFSALVGLGYDTSFGGNAGLRFAWGFTNTSGGGSIGNDIVFRNLLLQLYLGFRFKEIGG